MTKRRVDLDTLLREASIKPRAGKLTLRTTLPRHREVFLREIADEFSVKFVVKEKHEPGMAGFYGYAVGEVITLFHSEIPSYAWFICIAFHEIGHVLCTRAGRFKAYHDGVPRRTCVSTALRAERYVDAIAREFVRRRFPKIKFQESYTSSGDVKLLKNWMGAGRDLS
jgi:hypothetical protein